MHIFYVQVMYSRSVPHPPHVIMYVPSRDIFLRGSPFHIELKTYILVCQMRLNNGFYWSTFLQLVQFLSLWVRLHRSTLF